MFEKKSWVEQLYVFLKMTPKLKMARQNFKNGAKIRF